MGHTTFSIFQTTRVNDGVVETTLEFVREKDRYFIKFKVTLMSRVNEFFLQNFESQNSHQRGISLLSSSTVEYLHFHFHLYFSQLYLKSYLDRFLPLNYVWEHNVFKTNEKYKTLLHLKEEQKYSQTKRKKTSQTYLTITT